MFRDIAISASNTHHIATDYDFAAATDYVPAAVGNCHYYTTAAAWHYYSTAYDAFAVVAAQDNYAAAANHGNPEHTQYERIAPVLVEPDSIDAADFAHCHTSAAVVVVVVADVCPTTTVFAVAAAVGDVAAAVVAGFAGTIAVKTEWCQDAVEWVGTAAEN